jgi:hypothetical protein
MPALALAFVAFAVVAAVVVLTQSGLGLARAWRRLHDELAACPDWREVTVRFDAIEVTPLGGKVLRGPFRSPAARGLRLLDLPAAA